MTKSKVLKVIAVTVAVVALAGIAGATYLQSRPSKVKADEKFLPKASETPATSPSPIASTSAVPDGTKPLPVSTQPATSSSRSITITSPTSGSTVTDGSVISGRAQVFEGRLSFRLKGSNSGQLAGGFVQVSGDSSQSSPYSFTLGLTNQVCDSSKNCGSGAIDTGVLEVFSLSPKDGSEINQASIPVHIRG